MNQTEIRLKMNYDPYRKHVYPSLRKAFDDAFDHESFDGFFIKHVNSKPSVEGAFNPQAHIFLGGYIMARALVLNGDKTYEDLQDMLFMAFEHAAPEGINVDPNTDDLREKMAAFRPSFSQIQADIDQELKEHFLLRYGDAKKSDKDFLAPA